MLKLKNIFDIYNYIFLNFIAEDFYKLMDVMNIEIVFYYADCCLMSKRVLVGINKDKEVDLFLNEIVLQVV